MRDAGAGCGMRAAGQASNESLQLRLCQTATEPIVKFTALVPYVSWQSCSAGCALFGRNLIASTAATATAIVHIPVLQRELLRKNENVWRPRQADWSNWDCTAKRDANPTARGGVTANAPTLGPRRTRRNVEQQKRSGNGEGVVHRFRLCLRCTLLYSILR